MKRQLLRYITPAIVFGFCACFAGCNLFGSSEASHASKEKIEIDGSSTVFPLTEAIAKSFEQQMESNIIIRIHGTGGGFSEFVRGKVDINNASREISDEEIKICKSNDIEYHKITIAYDGIAVVVNKSNNFVNEISMGELKKIWGDNGIPINFWDQVNKDWPHEEIILYAPGEKSGTYDHFNSSILGPKLSCRKDYTSSENDNVLVKHVANDKGALGYFGFPYYEANKEVLKLLPIRTKNGVVRPSVKSISEHKYTPLSRPIYLYISKKSAQKEIVRKFVTFYMNNAQKIAPQVGFIPLSREKYQNELADFLEFCK